MCDVRWVMGARWASVAAAAAALACAPGGTPDAARQLPSVGVAVAEDGGTWCAVFDSQQPLERMDRVALVSPGPAGPVVLRGTLTPRMEGSCRVPFAQSGWHAHRVFDVTLSGDAGTPVWPDAAVAVTSAAEWSAGADGVIESDIDYDGRPEVLTTCLAGEGRHWTVWRRDDTGAGGRVRLWHGYYDLGAAVDPTCAPGEDGTG